MNKDLIHGYKLSKDNKKEKLHYLSQLDTMKRRLDENKASHSINIMKTEKQHP